MRAPIVAVNLKNIHFVFCFLNSLTRHWSNVARETLKEDAERKERMRGGRGREIYIMARTPFATCCVSAAAKLLRPLRARRRRVTNSTVCWRARNESALGANLCCVVIRHRSQRNLQLRSKVSARRRRGKETSPTKDCSSPARCLRREAGASTLAVVCDATRRDFSARRILTSNDANRTQAALLRELGQTVTCHGDDDDGGGARRERR